jgi:hypothetical protein
MMGALELPPLLIKVPFCKEGIDGHRYGEPNLSRHGFIIQSAQSSTPNSPRSAIVIRRTSDASAHLYPWRKPNGLCP